jgi:hypothetical protein
MRCTHAEKLIPLFAGDDLPAREAAALRRHLESCANCRRLADEFEESRDWLRGFAAPQFDDSMLDGMRDSVLQGIGRIENRARWLQWVVPGLNLRFVASLAALLLIAFIAAYVYRGKQRQMAPDKDYAVEIKPGGDQKNSSTGPRTDEDFRVNPSPIPTQYPSRKRRQRINESPGEKPVQLPDLAIAKPRISPLAINIRPIFDLPPDTDIAMDDAIFNREMTRIEFQTADPNIRIIWLTPKDSNPSSTKPNTNTR